MTEYVVGFMFTPGKDQVVLIKKARPQWQEGLLNGVGGKVEPGETPSDAMRREFREETSIDLTFWNDFGCIFGPEYLVHLFRGASAHAYNVRTMTDETVGLYSVSDLRRLPTVSNVPALVLLALTTVHNVRLEYL
jgi:8-oxo-dGTP diphosphatase